jgi:hypothetical protein
MNELANDHVALGDEIARLAARMNVATHRMLTCIREFDAAEGWHRQGAQSCAHWLTWRVGLNPGAAREKVRVARALGGLPALDRVFAEGRLSYAQVRAVTRIATPENEERVVDIAVAATGAQLERICRGFRKATQADEVHAAERSVRARVLGDGLVRLEVVLAADEADLVMKAVAEARKQLSSETMKPRGPANAGERPFPRMPVLSTVAAGMAATYGSAAGGKGEREAPRVCAADALVHLASTFLMSGAEAPERASDPALGGESPASAASPVAAGPRAEVVIHLSPELAAFGSNGTAAALGAVLDDGTNVSAETLRRAACDGGLVVATVDQTGEVLDVGRRTRAIPTAIWRALLIRDQHCRFPGCTNRSFLHGHHIVHWLHGGRKRDGEPVPTDGPMPPPLWDGDRVDYEACVDALMVS